MTRTWSRLTSHCRKSEEKLYQIRSFYEFSKSATDIVYYNIHIYIYIHVRKLEDTTVVEVKYRLCKKKKKYTYTVEI